MSTELKECFRSGSDPGLVEMTPSVEGLTECF